MSLPKMLHDRVLIKPDAVESSNDDLIGLEKKKANTGTVVSVGDGIYAFSGDDGIPFVLKIDMTLKVGDRVKYNDRVVSNFSIEGVDYVDCFERDVICVL